MRRSLRNSLLASYFFLVALFAGGVIMTLFVVRELGQRSELLVDRYWQDSRLVSRVHSLLSEVALFLNFTPEQHDVVAAQRDLQRNIDGLIAEFGASALHDEFRDEQIAHLRQLKASLAEPVALLARLETQNQAADAALAPLLAEAKRLGRDDIVRDLTIAALAYRDYYITANPSDREIFRRQLQLLDQRLPTPLFAAGYDDFRRQGEEVFARRLALRSSREEVVARVRSLSERLRERSEHYSRAVILPARAEISAGLAAIPNILLAAIVAGALAALGAAFLLARRISVPMEYAAVALRRIEQGDLAARVTPAGSEEIDLLGRAINSLAVSLSQTLADLNRTVNRLQESEDKYRQIAEQRLVLERIINTSPAVAFLSVAGAGYPLEFVSDSVAQFGYRPAELRQQGQPFVALVDPQDRPRLQAAIDRHIASGEEGEFFHEFRIVTPGGDRRWVDGRLLVRRDALGTVTHLKGVLLDITEKIRLREQAAQASRLASLGELAAGVAHEINNPNATILLNAGVLKEIGAGMLGILDELWRERGELALGRLPYPRLREEIPRLQSEVLEAAGRIRRIVEDLKEFAAAEPPEFRQPVELNAVVQTAVRLTGNALKKATDAFSAVYAAELPLFNGHAQRLEQVVVNLLMNACQSLPDRRCAILVSTGQVAGERAVYCEVRDQGAGIAPTDLPHVTDPFFTTRRDRGGTGLGLSVSARIVKEHGGRLEISSAPGAGTTVRVVLPYTDKELSA